MKRYRRNEGEIGRRGDWEILKRSPPGRGRGGFRNLK